MTAKRIARGMGVALALLATIPAFAAGDPGRGKALYETFCSGCHSVDSNRVGPAHRGVFGRKAGSAAGYSYSTTVAESSVIWSETSLDRWLLDPEKFIPGQKMGVSVANAADRQDLIAYLKALPSR